MALVVCHIWLPWLPICKWAEICNLVFILHKLIITNCWKFPVNVDLSVFVRLLRYFFPEYSIIDLFGQCLSPIICIVNTIYLIRQMHGSFEDKVWRIPACHDNSLYLFVLFFSLGCSVVVHSLDIFYRALFMFIGVLSTTMTFFCHQILMIVLVHMCTGVSRRNTSKLGRFWPSNSCYLCKINTIFLISAHLHIGNHAKHTLIFYAQPSPAWHWWYAIFGYHGYRYANELKFAI